MTGKRPSYQDFCTIEGQLLQNAGEKCQRSTVAFPEYDSLFCFVWVKALAAPAGPASSSSLPQLLPGTQCSVDGDTSMTFQWDREGIPSHGTSKQAFG